MGRHRVKDRHLPPRVYLRAGRYYYDSPVTKRWESLGRDLPEALALYGQKIGGAWGGRTLGDVIDRYRVEVLPQKRSSQTRQDEAKALERLKLVFGAMNPDAVTTQHCYRYADQRRRKDGRVVPTAARHEVALLGHVFAKAIRWGVATANPVRAMEKQRRGRRTRYVTDEEFSAVRELADERLQIAMDLARLTGQRRGDLLTLRREQITGEGIVFRQSKTGAGVLVEWTAELQAVITRAKQLAPQLPGLYLIRTRRGGPYTARGFSAMWQRLMAKAVAAGVPRFSFHDLRAKAASDSSGLEAAAALLGHASSETTKRVYKRNLTRAKAVK